MKFEITQEQVAKINEWAKKHSDVYTGAFGGRYSYTFTPTNLGLVTKVYDPITKETLDITDYENW